MRRPSNRVKPRTLTSATIYSFGYDALGRLVRLTDRYGQTTTIERDALGAATALVASTGQKTLLQVDAAGNLIGIRAPARGPITFGYGPNGVLQSAQEPEGASTSFQYDSLGRIISRPGETAQGMSESIVPLPYGSRLGISTPAGVNSTMSYVTLPDGTRQQITLSADGLGTQVTVAPDGTVTRRLADGTLQTMLSRPDPIRGMQSPSVQGSIRLPSGLTLTHAGGRSSSVDAIDDDPSVETDTASINGRVTRAILDRLNRTVTRTTAAGRVHITTMDPSGQATLDSIPGKAAARYAYDSVGQLSSISRAGRMWSFQYDQMGHLIRRTSPYGRQSSFEHDSAGRVTRYTAPDGASTLFTFNSDNLLAITPPARQAYQFTYDSLGRPTGLITPRVGSQSNQISYTYDSEGRPSRLYRAAGDSVAYAYDANGRLASATTRAGAINYAFDANTGKLTKATITNGASLDYAWDGSVPTKLTWTGAVSGSLAMTYNADLVPNSESVNGAYTVQYGYDAEGLLTQAGALTLTRSPATGQPIGSVIGSLTTTVTLNEWDEVVGLQLTNGGTPLFSSSLTRDSLGRITDRSETIQGMTTAFRFAYDTSGRLATVTRNGVPEASYLYDANGSRSQATGSWGVSDVVVDAQDRVVQNGQTSYTYTPDGDLASATANGITTTFDFSPLGPLTTVARSNGSRIDYILDAEGRRVGRKLDGTLDRAWIYGLSGEVLAELDGGGQVLSRFVYGDDRSVPLYMVRAGQTFRLFTDERGSVRLVVDITSGQIAQRIDYDAFGRVTSDTRPGFQPFGYAGGLYDTLTGFVHFAARDYNPETGTWTSRDPLGFGGGQTNLYQYASGDPINRSDRTGEHDILDQQGAMSLNGNVQKINIPMEFYHRLVKKGTCLVLELAVDAAAFEAAEAFIYVATPGFAAEKTEFYVGKTIREITTRLAEHGDRFKFLTGAIRFNTSNVSVGEAEASILARVVQKMGGEFGLSAVRAALKVDVLNKIMPSHYIVTPFCKDSPF